MLYKLYETFLWRQIKNGPAPGHIGLIVDGNRRFARGRGLAQNLGHEDGSKKLEEFLILNQSRKPNLFNTNANEDKVLELMSIH